MRTNQARHGGLWCASRLRAGCCAENICDTVESGLREMAANKSQAQTCITRKLKPANEMVGYGLANGPQDRQLSVQDIKETVQSIN